MKKSKVLLLLITCFLSVSKTYSQTSPAVHKPIGNPGVINMAPCVNEGFESTPAGAYTGATNSLAVTGWTIESSTTLGMPCPGGPTVFNPGSPEFSIATTPAISVPNLTVLPHSPLGGTKVAKLNNFNLGSSSICTRISSKFPVTTSNNLFRYAYAGSWQVTQHGGCCGSPFVTVNFYDCSGNLLSCISPVITPYNGCSNLTEGTYSTSTGFNSAKWCNWTVRTVDLSPFIGSCITVEVTTGNCPAGIHFATTYFDAACGSQHIPNGFVPLANLSLLPVYFCPGSSQAVLNAPLGYATYSWVAPALNPSLSPSQATLSSVTISTVGLQPFSVYTVNLTRSTCLFAATVALSSSQVSITAMSSVPSCSAGANGSATVSTAGSSNGYSYSWVNSTSSVVSTSAAAYSLAPGSYTVFVSVPNFSSCGTASTAITILSTGNSVSNLSKPYCNGNTAYFTTFPGASNIQWYNGFTPIPPPQGTAPSFTLSPAINGSFYRVGYNNQGCRDSTIYSLTASPVSNSVSCVPSSTFCPSTNSGSAVVTMTPSPFAFGGLNTFKVFIINTSSPTYTVLTGPVSANTITASNLPVGYTYSVSAFDGSCYSGDIFTITPVIIPFDFALSPSSPTVCQGSSISTSLSLTYPYICTYSWSPTTFLAASNGTLQNPVITPSTSPGTVGTTIYTIVATPYAANCPMTNTLSVTVANLQPPVISPIPMLCENGPTYTVAVNPPGGIFNSGTNNPIANPGGLLSPSLAPLGISSFTYVVSSGSCVASNVSHFSVVTKPAVSISGNTIVCKGQLATFTASGADTYTWSTGATGSVMPLSFLSTGPYSVYGVSNFAGCGNNQTTHLTIFDCVGLDQLERSSGQFAVYPNPNIGSFKIESQVPAVVGIYDQLGRLVFTKQIEQGTTDIDISHLSIGLYHLRYSSGNEDTIVKMLRGN